MWGYSSVPLPRKFKLRDSDIEEFQKKARGQPYLLLRDQGSPPLGISTRVASHPPLPPTFKRTVLPLKSKTRGWSGSRTFEGFLSVGSKGGTDPRDIVWTGTRLGDHKQLTDYLLSSSLPHRATHLRPPARHGVNSVQGTQSHPSWDPPWFPRPGLVIPPKTRVDTPRSSSYPSYPNMV